MNILGNSIKEIRKSKKMTQKELSALTGFKQNTISNHENGKRQLDEVDIRKYAKALNVEPQQLFDNASHTPSEAVIRLDKELHPDNHKSWVSYGNKLLDKQKTVIDEPLELYEVHTTTKLAAGLGYAFNDYDMQTVYVENKPPRYDLASFINGDSMEPKYHDGDIVYLVDKGFSSYSGEICAIAIDGKTYLKKVYTEKGRLRLVSLNSKYDDIILPFPPEDGHIRIYSVVGTDKVVE